MNIPGKNKLFSCLSITVFSSLCFPYLLPAQTEHPLRLLKPDAPGGSAPSSGAPAAPTPGDVPLTFHDIHGPVAVAEPVNWLLYTLIGVVCLLVLAGLWWWFRIRKKPAPPAIPAGVTARNELMLAREMMTAELQLQYMERVSAILRNYLEQRFELPTSRQTTREFFAALQGSKKLYKELKRYSDDLRNCLEQCDLAKFAHHASTVDSLQQMEDSILRFINRTEMPASEPWQEQTREAAA